MEDENEIRKWLLHSLNSIIQTANFYGWDIHKLIEDSQKYNKHKKNE